MGCHHCCGHRHRRYCPYCGCYLGPWHPRPWYWNQPWYWPSPKYVYPPYCPPPTCGTAAANQAKAALG